MAAALQIGIQTDDLRQLNADLKAAGVGVPAELQRGLNAAAQPVVSSVRAAASFSRRIPGAVQAKTSFGGASPSVRITVDSNAAPEAAPLEHHGQGGTFEHPVFGHMSVRVAQPAQPFFSPGVQNADSQINTAMLAVLDAIAQKAGFR